MYGINLTRREFDAVNRVFESVFSEGVQEVRFGSLVKGNGQRFVTVTFIGFGQNDAFHIDSDGNSAVVDPADGQSEFSRPS